MATAEDLLVRIDATTESLRRELRRGDQAVAGFKASTERSLAGIDKAFAGLGVGLGKINGILGAIGVGVGVGALVNLGRSALNLADDLQDTAAQLGVSTDALQVFRFAAAETGVQAGQLDQALLKLNTTIGDAASGDDAAEKKFKALGISFTDAEGRARSSEAVLADLADLIQSLASPAERAAAAATLLGDRAGPRLVPLLADGAQGLRDYGVAARDAFQVLGDETLTELAKAQREIEKFTNALTIGAGEFIKFAIDLDKGVRQDGAELKLGRISGEIERLNAIIDEAKSDPDADFAGLNAKKIADAEASLRELRVEAEKLQRFLGVNQPQGHAGRGITFVPKPSTGSIDLGGSGDTEAEAAAKKLQAALRDLGMEVDALTGSDREDRLAKWLDRAGVTASSEAGLGIALMVDELERADIATQALAASRDADKEAVAEWNKLQEEGRTALESVRTPMEDYNATLERATFLLNEGVISQETFNRLVDRAGDAFVAADERAQLLVTSAGEIGRGFVNAFGQAAISGNSLKDVLRGLLTTLAGIAANAAGTGIEGWIAGILKSGLSVATGSFNGSNPNTRALGGPVMAGVPYRINETGGQEIFIPNVNGMIKRADQVASDRTGMVINNSISVSTTGGTPEQNRQGAEAAAAAMTKAMESFFDGRLGYQLRGGGMLRPSIA